MLTNDPAIPDDAEQVVIEHQLPREITSWKLAGLMASDGRAFLRCQFEQEVGGEPDPKAKGGFVGAEQRTFTVHWELNSLKEFLGHLFTAASEIERRAGIDDEDGFGLAPLLAGALATGSREASSRSYNAGYL